MTYLSTEQNSATVERLDGSNLIIPAMGDFCSACMDLGSAAIPGRQRQGLQILFSIIARRLCPMGPAMAAMSHAHSRPLAGGRELPKLRIWSFPI